MYFETAGNKHGLRHNPLKALVAPRPIGWISTLDRNGVRNLAPFSFFNLVCDIPPIVMFSSSGAKDSRINAAATGEFVVSMATWDLRHQVNASSEDVAPEVDEFALAKVTPAASRLVKPPRVAESPMALECRYLSAHALPAPGPDDKLHTVTFGEVIGIYIDDRFVRDGLVDTGAMQPIARLGYRDYAVFRGEQVFAMDPPGQEGAADAGIWVNRK